MSHQPSLTRRIVSKDGEDLATLVMVFSLNCIHCRKPVEEGQPFYAAADPYNGVLHSVCAPFYSYPRCWPHEFPLVAFTKSENK